jgi:signal transduction histidine kinase
MSMLMEEVLLLGMADAGKLDFKPAPLDLESFSRRLIEDVLSVTNRHCPIELQLPESAEPAFGDERLLRHIFSNLLSNAVKYSPASDAVEFQIHREGPDAVCRVRDQGLGIPEEDVGWLFSAFHRGERRSLPGTGLGLTIVAAWLHGGQIGESKPGARLLRFACHFPAAPPNRNSDRPVSPCSPITN